MTDGTLLTPLLAGLPDGVPADRCERLRAALAADPALSGRASSDEQGVVHLTGPSGGPAPVSVKERRRWELHVLMRVAAELGADTAATISLRWTQPAPS